jgi:RND superfamily putative drug exporter
MLTLRNVPAIVVTHRRIVLLAWTLAAGALLPLARGVERRLETGTRVPGSESARVAELLTTTFASPFARYAVLVMHGIPGLTSDSGRATLRRIVDQVRANHDVAATFSLLDVRDSLFVGDGGATFVVVGLRQAGTSIDSVLPSLRATTAALLPAIRATNPGAELLWTGELPLTVDLRRVSADDANRAERRVLPVTLALLVVAFGAFGAALLPVAIGALSIAMTMGAVALLTHVLPVSILVLNVATMLGLGLGIDYALLLVSRFREGRGRGLSSDAAAIEAARHAGHSIALSGMSVLVGFLALLLVPLTDLRSIAIGGALVTTVSVLLATTLLPGILATLGDRVEVLGLRRRWITSGAASDFWRRWSGAVVRRPFLVLLVAGVPTAALALQWRRLETHTPSGDWLPASIESARGLHALQAMRRSGIVQSVRVIVELPEGALASSPDGLKALVALTTRLRSSEHIARLTPSAVSPDKRLVLLEIMPVETKGVAAAMSLVREIRQLDPVVATGLRGTRLQVGGLPAFNVDYGDGIAKATPRVVVLVVVGTFLALLIGFRSLLIPLKAIALNLLSVSAAFGAVVLVFQKGYASGFVGLSAPLDGIFPAVPLLVFCTVFGLSMDYEVFLVSRVAEARRLGRSESDAVVEGVSRTGGVITSAAVVMIVVFGAFMMGEFVLMKILGFALAVAVLLDVTIIRLALGPALLRLAGRWNWWPGVRGVPGTITLAPARGRVQVDPG